MSRATKILIADDHSIMRDGLQEVFEHADDLEVVGQARDGAEAVDLARRLAPDVIVMDVMMPIKDGIDACREITKALPDTRVLVLTASTDEQAVVRAVAAGATGYLQKFSGKEELLMAIRDVAAGGFRIPGALVRQVFKGITHVTEGSDASASGKLTSRQTEILKLFAQGMSYAEIADAIGKRPLTIRNAVYRIRDKLGAQSTQEMVVWAVRNGLLDGNAQSSTDQPKSPHPAPTCLSPSLREKEQTN